MRRGCRWRSRWRKPSPLPVQGLLPTSPHALPEAGAEQSKSFHCALTASDELRDSLEAEHHAVGGFIAAIYAPDVRGPPLQGLSAFALVKSAVAERTHAAAIGRRLAGHFWVASPPDPERDVRHFDVSWRRVWQWWGLPI